MGAHIRQLKKSLGSQDAATLQPQDDVPFPLDLGYLWSMFTELHSARNSNGTSPHGITFLEIGAYCALTGYNVRPWEVEVLRKLDTAWLASWNDERSRRTKSKGPG